MTDESRTQEVRARSDIADIIGHDGIMTIKGLMAIFFILKNWYL
jgi:hypothetical protein